VVDEQADGAARRGPAPGDQLVGARRAAAGALEAQVEIEVALPSRPAGAEAAVAAAGARAEPAAADEQP
jgi:hypothetical protein